MDPKPIHAAPGKRDCASAPHAPEAQMDHHLRKLVQDMETSPPVLRIRLPADA